MLVKELCFFQSLRATVAYLSCLFVDSFLHWLYSILLSFLSTHLPRYIWSIQHGKLSDIAPPLLRLHSFSPVRSHVPLEPVYLRQWGHHCFGQLWIDCGRYGSWMGEFGIYSLGIILYNQMLYLFPTLIIYHVTLMALQNHSIRWYEPITLERGCSKRKLPPHATVRASRRTHLG